MSYENERQAITQAFKTAWEAGSNLPVQHFNRDFDPPADGGPYLKFFILRGTSATASLNSGNVQRYRHPGLVQIDIVISQGKGSRIGLDLVDEVAAIFRGQNIGGIIFRAPDVTEIDEAETSRVSFIVSIPFHRDSNF